MTLYSRPEYIFVNILQHIFINLTNSQQVMTYDDCKWIDTTLCLLSPDSVSVSAFPDFDIERVKCFVFTSRQVPASASSQAVSLSLSLL